MKELQFVYIGIDVSKVSLSIDAGDHYYRVLCVCG